jgi:hypothetical protein
LIFHEEKSGKFEHKSSQIHYGLTTNGVVITDAIKFVQTNKEKLSMSTKEEDKDKDSKGSKEHGYDEEKDQLEEKQEEETGTTNQVF